MYTYPGYSLGTGWRGTLDYSYKYYVTADVSWGGGMQRHSIINSDMKQSKFTHNTQEVKVTQSRHAVKCQLTVKLMTVPPGTRMVPFDPHGIGS